MKKLIIVFLLLHLSTHSQENDKYYFRMHYLDVSGNVGAFIKANKEYFKLPEQNKGVQTPWLAFPLVIKKNKMLTRSLLNCRSKTNLAKTVVNASQAAFHSSAPLNEVVSRIE